MPQSLKRQPLSEPWWDELKALQNALRSDPDRALRPYVAEDSDEQQLPFADLWLPVVDDAVARLRDSLSDLQTRSFQTAPSRLWGNRC